ncbi:MAG: TolC family protein [Elusimicrobia bacterium]|nr:TolC family protein [Elusimicrobiota bacterium]
MTLDFGPWTLDLLKAEPWTLDRYIEEALRRSPEFAESQEDLVQADSKKTQAIAESWLPEITATAKTYPYGYNPDNNDNFSSWDTTAHTISYSAKATLNLFNSFSDVRDVTLAKLGLHDAQDDLIVQHRSLIIKAMSVYLDFFLKTKRLEVIMTNAKNRREQYELTEGLYREGLKSLYDVQKTQIDLYSGELRETSARNERQLALARFNLLLDQPLQVEPELAPLPESALGRIPVFDEALKLALQNRPEARKARRTLESKRLTLRQEGQDVLPGLSADLSGSWSQEPYFDGVNPQLGERKTGYNIAVSLSYSFGLGPWPSWQEYIRAESSLRQAELDLAEIIRNVQEEVVSAHLELDRSQKAFNISRLKELLVRESASQVRERYRQGASGILELTQAEQDLLQSELESSDLLKDYYLAQAKYTMAVGLWTDRK